MRRSWLQVAPEGCAIGFSGPTLDPGDAIRRSRRSAVGLLASGSAQASVHVDSTLLVADPGRRGGEFTRQDIEGAVQGSRIVAIWAETAPDSSTTQVRHVYALACRKGFSPPGVALPDLPPWVLETPHEPGRVCALGVGGPTWDPRDQRPSTLRDGKRALAAALESRLHQIVIDTGRSSALVATELETTDRALARAEAALDLDEEWWDGDGSGPLGLRSVLYGLVCIPL